MTEEVARTVSLAPYLLLLAIYWMSVLAFWRWWGRRQARQVAASAALRSDDRPFHVALTISASQLTAAAGMLMLPIILLLLLALLRS